MKDSDSRVQEAVLVTGGTGFIGSHICVELLENNYKVVVVDNLCNSNQGVLERIKKITGKDVIFYNTDIRDRSKMEDIFSREKIDAVIHCAGLKSVSESVANPLWYYDNNIHGSIVLTQTMSKYKVKTLVFSSSATVYGENSNVPYVESTPLKPVNPYGKTKLFIEEMLRDLASSDPEWHISLLRYFNPIGAHPSGLIGEEPRGVPNNVMPYICQVALGKRPELLVFGNDYDTPDGTGVRDYIHVVDLAKGHLSALSWMKEHQGILTANLGTGKGVSVLELIDAFGRASSKPVPHRIVGRRDGDIPTCYADPSYAQRELKWSTTRTLLDACSDSWHWQNLNPQGYDTGIL